MTSETPQQPVSKAALWTSYVLSALPVALFVFSAVMKFIKPPALIEGMTQQGWPHALALPIGITELVSTLLYAIPQTAVLGAILLTGYLGGAMATHIRIGEPFITHIVLGLMIWGALWLRDTRLRQLLPLRS